MTTTTYPHMPPLEDSSFLRVGERRFPLLEKQGATYARPVPQLKVDHAAMDIHRGLADDLWGLLPYAALEAPCDLKTQDLVQTYIDSLSQIGRFIDDVHRLVRAICEASLEFRQESGPTDEEARSKAVTALLEELTEKHKLFFPPAENVLHADLVAQPVELLHFQLQAALKDAVTTFIAQFFEGLETLVDGKCVGLIDWTGKNICRYHFFREVVLQENDGVQQVLYGSDASRDDASREEGVSWEQVTEISGGRHIHRHGRHEHHVMDAFHTSIKNSRVVMPPAVGQLIARIPDWLYPYVQIVDGTIFRERIVEEDYREDQWQTARTYDVPIFGCEPAVIIGQFVMTGWGPREIEAERDRTDEATKNEGRAQAVRAASRARAGWSMTAVVTHLSSIILMGRAAELAPSWSTPAAVLFLVGLWSTWQALQAHAVLRNVFPGPLRIAAGVWSIGLLIVAVQVLVIRGTIETPILRGAPLILLPTALLLALFGLRGFRSQSSRTPPAERSTTA